MLVYIFLILFTICTRQLCTVYYTWFPAIASSHGRLANGDLLLYVAIGEMSWKLDARIKSTLGMAGSLVVYISGNDKN